MMLPETKALIFSGMDDEEWRTFEEIAKACQQTIGNVKLRIYELHRRGEVQKMCTSTAGCITKWRIPPTGYIEPLYDCRDGWDAWPLAKALGGYSYK